MTTSNVVVAAVDEVPQKDKKNSKNHEFVFDSNWGVVRSSFHNGNHDTNSETYKEKWKIEQINGQVYLVSPRARIRLVDFLTSPLDGRSIERIKLHHEQLFKLLGIKVLGGDSLPENMEALANAETSVITISSTKGGLGSTKVLSYSLPNEEQIQIELKFDSNIP